MTQKHIRYTSVSERCHYGQKYRRFIINRLLQQFRI